MEIDHIFIFSRRGTETDELVDFGLTEGSGRKHEGIGTANRRIFFENFYIEVLWVEDAVEAQSVANLGIWERSNFADTGYSKFGICLENTKSTDEVFTNSIQWCPQFLAQRNHVDILTNKYMPWIFRFPKSRGDKNVDEPREHAANISKLSKVTLKLRDLDFADQLELIVRRSIIEFVKSSEELLVLEFDNGMQGKEMLFESLNLKIVY